MSHEPERDEALRLAGEAVGASEAAALADPRRPRYHFHGRARWMNDPNGPIFHDGWYHLFYQHNPFGSRCWGDPSARVYWGHARSRDMLHWEHRPPALWPSTAQGEEHCWSGSCVIRDDGRPMIFYTSIGPAHQPGDSAEQWAALGDPDLETWTKHPRNPMLAGREFGGARILDWRDPFVFREGGAWYLVTGGHRENGRGCLTLFRSTDLERWEFAGIPFEGTEANWECPALFRLGDRWALVYSPHAPVQYMTGRLDLERCRFEPETRGQFDYGKFIGFYAATVMTAPDRRTILWAWMHSDVKDRAWNGCLLLPRELRLLQDGKIAQPPIAELERLRRDARSDGPFRLAAGETRRYEVRSGCAELALTLGDCAGRFGVRLRSRNACPAADIVCRPEGVAVAGDRIPAAELGGCHPREIRVFMDRSLLEVFFNNRFSVSRWLEAEAIESIELFCDDGGAELKRVDLWRLEETAAFS